MLCCYAKHGDWPKQKYGSPNKDASMGAGKFENRHGVGILLNKKWLKRQWTEYIDERAIATLSTVNKQKIMLMSVYFPHTGYVDHHVEKAYRTLEKFTKSKKNIQIVGGDFNAELGHGVDVERNSVGQYTLKDSNMRGDWMKQWLIVQKLVALNTIHKKTDKQVTYRNPEGAEKQLDYILTKRKYLTYSGNAEANNMINMGSDNRIGMAQFVIPAPNKGNSQKRVHSRKEGLSYGEHHGSAHQENDT